MSTFETLLPLSLKIALNNTTTLNMSPHDGHDVSESQHSGGPVIMEEEEEEEDKPLDYLIEVRFSRRKEDGTVEYVVLTVLNCCCCCCCWGSYILLYIYIIGVTNPNPNGIYANDAR
jgi:hypothetical protein